MSALLFLAHRMPYPPNKGDKIRSWNILRHLAARYDVHLGCFVDDPYDWQYVDRLREICGDCHFARLGPMKKKFRGLAGFADGRALTLRCYRDAGLGEWVRGVVARHAPERVFVFSSAMAQYVMPAPGEGDGVRRIIDFVDVDSDKWRQYADSKSWPLSSIFRREGRTLLAFERLAAAAFDVSLFTSAAEVALFRRLAPESAGKVFAIGNGVDFEFFSPRRIYDDPFSGDRGVLVFTGAMDYWPNIDAVVWFAHEILPEVRRRRPGTRFFVVGANPAGEVRRLAALPGVSVTGRVPDVRPYLAHAAAVVAPMRIARGVQNKVLEAMAMAKAVVATPQAMEGLDVGVDSEVLVAADAGFFAETIDRLLAGDDAAALGGRGRDRVVSDFGWSASLARLDGLLGAATIAKS